MSNQCFLQLKKDIFSNLSIENYEKNYTICVNGKDYKINRLFADLLSPRINSLHFTDPTNEKFMINTKTQGHFSKFLKLLNFEQIQFDETEIPFISEVTNILGNNYIQFAFQRQEDQSELTLSSSLSNLKKLELYEITNIYQAEKDIDFISTHFCELSEEEEEELIQLTPKIIERIFGHNDLMLKSEDQLLRIINKLYESDSNNCFLYEYVQFEKVSDQIISEFITIFDYNDMNHVIWEHISKRLKKELKNTNNNNEQRYKKPLKVIKISYDNKNEFNGIINYIRQQNNNIKDEVNITASSVIFGNPYLLLDYKDIDQFFITSNLPDAWVCIEFKGHTIIPTHYTIRSVPSQPNNHPRSWVIEGSMNNKNYFVIDEQINCEFLNGKSYVHTFEIPEKNQKEIRYFRMKQTDTNWFGNFHHLVFNAIEVYGSYI